jgi:signal transduction histidine kinase
MSVSQAVHPRSGAAHRPRVTPAGRGRAQRRLALVFALQLIGTVIAVLLGSTGRAPVAAVLALIAVIAALSWLAVRREWRGIHSLAGLLEGWNEQKPDPQVFNPARLPKRSDADLVALAHALHGFAERIAGYTERERNFTRDASHELRSPLTVIKMSADLLDNETALTSSGLRSVRRIRRAAREMEALVESFLVLAREADIGRNDEEYVVNDVLQRELAELRQLLEGRPVELALEEPARFALQGSSRVFAVLCWQLIRNAAQHAGEGRIVLSVLPDAVTVTSTAQEGGLAPAHSGFELAIAQRISERFGWTLEIENQSGAQRVARIRFPHPLPA